MSWYEVLRLVTVLLLSDDDERSDRSRKAEPRSGSHRSSPTAKATTPTYPRAPYPPPHPRTRPSAERTPTMKHRLRQPVTLITAVLALVAVLSAAAVVLPGEAGPSNTSSAATQTAFQ